MMQRMMLAILVLNTLAIAGIGYFSYTLYKDRNAHANYAASMSMVQGEPGSEDYSPRPIGEPEEYKFFPVEKVIVSLKGDDREYYFILDLVLQSPPKMDNKKLQQVDPMVRNSVVAHLSALSVDELRSMSIPDLQKKLESVIRNDFTARQVARPFSSVLVSKMVVQ
jgi:flagellar FliL protein